MNETIKLILSLSLSGSIIAAILFTLKPLIKHKLSRSIQYYLWLVVLLRLVIPFSFEGSIMNGVFYRETPSVVIDSQGTVLLGDITSEGADNSPILQKSQQNTTSVSLNSSGSIMGRNFKDLFNEYALYLWILGTVIALTANIIEYAKFLKFIKQANVEVSYEQNRMLSDLLKGRKKVRLVRNRFAATPMLVGVLRPCIIIPDTSFNEKQLKNILLHEITHLKRFDIGIKWLTMIAACIHWFNPMMYFIKKEINGACELSCDEAVIKNLSMEEKQTYGDTLISVVADHKYPLGTLQTTMCEDKKSLRERLVAIMNHSKKSRVISVFSAALLGVIILGAVYLGAGVGILKGDTPPNVYINAENEHTKTAVRVDMPTYNLAEISKYKTLYIGDNSKVSAIVGGLPVPDSYFRQQYISMVTDKKPYGLSVFYEARGTTNSNEEPIINPDSVAYDNLRKNALVLFSMIDNLDSVTFAFRNSQSEGKLDSDKYNNAFTFSRASIEEKYGNLSEIGKKLDLLEAALSEVW